MAKSIIQDTRIRECYLCREEAEKRGYYGELKHTGLHKHHFIYGRFGAFRKKAEHYGLWGYVCTDRHHEHGPESPHDNAEVALHLKQVAPHNNAEVDRRLKQIAQRAFEAKYGHEKWMQEFEKNYLEEEEDAEREAHGEHEASGFFRSELPSDSGV